MNRRLRQVLIVLVYFFVWWLFYSGLYMIDGEATPLLLPQFRTSYAFRTIMISFIRALPALEIVAILVLFTLSASLRSPSQLKKHSDSMRDLLSRLFVACIVASAVNMTMFELIRPSLIYSRNRQITLSQKYYESINNYSEAVANKDYEMASEALQLAFSIWDESPEVLSLQGQLANIRDEKSSLEENKNSAELLSYHITIPESMEAKDILKIAKERIKINDFYTAYHYSALVAKISKEDVKLKEEAMELQQFCMGKISIGNSLDKLLASQRQFEAKRLGYDALSRKNYKKAYYAFLDIHNEILETTNKYNPDVEKNLGIARTHLLEEVFFIEEIDNVVSFNSGYNIKFKIEDRGEQFNIGSFYFSNKKDSFSIYLSNLKYQKISDAGVILSKIDIPYAKIIEKKIDGKQRLYLLVESLSKYSKDKVIPSNKVLKNIEKTEFPLDLEMSLKDFSLIVLAQQEPHAMTIIDLYNFIPITRKYGFEYNVYQAELCTRFADFFFFIICTVLASIMAFKLRPVNINKCTSLFLTSALVFPYILFVIVDVIKHLFKVFVTLIITIGIPFPSFTILLLLFIAFIGTACMLYNVGDA